MGEGIDYWYLLLGSLGIAVSVSRLEILGGQKIEILDELGPLVLTAAVAFRLVKTKVESKSGQNPKSDRSRQCGTMVRPANS